MEEAVHMALPPTVESDELRFAFGENWRDFVRAGIDRERVDAAIASLRRLLGRDDLHDCVFIDVGCGSGLFSLAAVELGAAHVVAFDADQAAVEAAAELCRLGRARDRWEIRYGSVLDAAFIGDLPRGDVVYAWGVLHHTGALWQAIDNTASLLKPGGRMALAIYNEVDSWLGGSRQWRAIKRLYNRAPRPQQIALEDVYMVQRAARDLIMMRDPSQRWRRLSRGMSYRNDVRDWLGGLPFEYARPSAVIDYVQGKLGLELCYTATFDGHQCNEFTFRRP